MMQPSDFVDRGDVVGSRLEAEARPVELLCGDYLRNVVAKVHAPEGAGTMCEVHLNELLFHVQQNVSRDLVWCEAMTDAAEAQYCFANLRKVLRERCDSSYSGAKTPIRDLD